MTTDKNIARDQIACRTCGKSWETHSQADCPYGRKPAEYTADPTTLMPRQRDCDLIARGIVYQAVAAQLAVIERRVRWGWILGYFYDEDAEQHDHYQVKVLRAWLQEHQ